jgi:hypothetical protein
MLSAKEGAKITSAHYNFDEWSHDPKVMEQKIKSDLPSDFYVNYGLSNRGVMVAERGNQRVISVKGTDPTNRSDILSDLQLALGLHKSNIQFRQRKNEIKNIMRRDPEKEYYLVGHSLGSSIITNALASSPSILRNVKKAYTFNTGSTPAFQAMLKPRKENETMLNEKLEHHQTKSDPISAFGNRFGTTIFHKQKSRNPFTAHSITNFT